MYRLHKRWDKITGYCKNEGFIGVVNIYVKEGRIVGTMKNGEINGNAKFYFNNGIYFEGSFKDNQPNGPGILYSVEGDKIEGVFGKGFSIIGNVRITFKNKDFYEGEIQNNARNGSGKMSFSDGGYYEGNWLNNLFDGYGFYRTSPNMFISNCPKCVEYQGEFLNDLKHGKGKCFDSKGNLIYEGKFVNNIPVDKYPSNRKK